MEAMLFGYQPRPPQTAKTTRACGLCARGRPVVWGARLPPSPHAPQTLGGEPPKSRAIWGPREPGSQNSRPS
eukprot:13015797-Alexandrium_andersonii.AAC.1